MTPDSIISAEEFDEPYVFISGYIPLNAIVWRAYEAAALSSMWDVIDVDGVEASDVVSEIDIAGTVGIAADSVLSEEYVSDITLEIDLLAFPTSIVSEEAFEAIDVLIDLIADVDSVESAESISDVTIRTDSQVDSVESAEFVSDIEVIAELVIFAGSITSTEIFDGPTIINYVHADSIDGAEAVGEPTVTSPIIVSADSIDSEESVSTVAIQMVLYLYPTSIDAEESVEDVQINQTTNISQIYNPLSVGSVVVSLTYYADEISSEEDVPELAINYVEYVTELTVEDSSSVEDVALTEEAIIRADSILSRENVAAVEVGINRIITAESIDDTERISRIYLHHPMSELTVGDESVVSDIDATVHVPVAYPLSILSDGLLNNVLAYQANVINPFAGSSESEVGLPSFYNNGEINVPELNDGEEFGGLTLSLTMTEITVSEIETEEVLSDVLLTDTFVLPKQPDAVYANYVLSVLELYGQSDVNRAYSEGAWEWDLTNAYYEERFVYESTYIEYGKEEVVNPDTHEIEIVSTETPVTVLRDKYPFFHKEQWSLLIEAHQWEWQDYFKNYYGLAEEWILHGSNTVELRAYEESGEITHNVHGSWHVDNPLAELSPLTQFDGELFPVSTNLSVVDDRIAELRANSPTGIVTTSAPQTVYATISATTAEVTDTLSANCEYVIEDQVANYDLYEGISVSPALNYIFDVPEPSYIKGIPVIPALRTDPLCAVDIGSRALHIGADAYGKLNFFGVAPDILGETVTDTDYKDELPPSLYRPLKPPYVQPDDPTSEFTAPEMPEPPEMPDGWDGWEPEDPADDGDEVEDGWEEDPAEGVTPTTGVMYKDFPLNLYGGGTVIMSGIPKYKNNGKKKWLFATAKKKQKKSKDDDVCVDEDVNDGPKYIGLYIRNGNLVLTDGEFVLRTKAPPRGQRVLVFAGYYGDKSFVGWWKNPKHYKYRYGELGERSTERAGVTLIMIGRGWGTKSAGEAAGNGFTIGSIKIVDETSDVGSFGTSTDDATTGVIGSVINALPTPALDAIAQESAQPVADYYSQEALDYYVIDQTKPHDPVIEGIYDSIRSAMEEYNDTYQKLMKYPNMPADQKNAANAVLSSLTSYLSDLRATAEEVSQGKYNPNWVHVPAMTSEEREQYFKDYAAWKTQSRMIGYFSINDSSRVGVPGVR